MSMLQLPDGPEAVEAISSLTATSRSRLVEYAALVRTWQGAKNLVAPSTIADMWRRHMADGAQAFAAFPEGLRWLDLGSGAGFPGLVTSILLADQPGASVTLVESNGRKAAFLRTVIRELQLPARVLAERIEDVAHRFGRDIGSIDALSARALAPLADLMALSAPWLTSGSVGVFHKGRGVQGELAVAAEAWTFDHQDIVSKVDPEGRIVILRHVRPRTQRDQQ